MVVYHHNRRDAHHTIMIIIHDYWIDDKSKPDLFLVKSRETAICPICGNLLKVIGSRKRSLIEFDGHKKTLIIRRLKCEHCIRIHHELPDIIVPYKRYSSEAIESGICSIQEGLPCEFTTIRSWKIWFYLLEEYFEATLEAIKLMYTDYIELQKEISLLQPLKNRKKEPDGWLKKLVRITVNLNRWIHTRSAFA